MKVLKVSEIIELIKAKRTFEATTPNNAFTIKVNRYVPYCCTAIHDGNALRKELKEKIALDDYERWFEEDPYTGDFIRSMPITIIGNDSRFEYDLNRSPEDCIYEEAWGKKVWKRKLTVKEKQISLKKHHDYYEVLHALIHKLESLYDGCVVYDLHSYNYQRWEQEVPLFNIGTENIDCAQFASIIDHWMEELKAIELPNITNETKENDVFNGRGYNLISLTNKFKKTLVLATEVKKVYCNELTGEDYPEIVKEIQQNLKQAIINNALIFTQQYTNWNSKASINLLGKNNDPALLKLDKKLFQLVKSFELLAYVNPINSRSEQKKFTRNKFAVEPEFKYSPIKIDPYQLKRQLSQLRTLDITDVSIRHMYESVINSYFDKIDLLANLDTRKFLYNSLRYFGRPSQKDIKNANYLLHLPAIPTEPNKTPIVPMGSVIEQFKTALDDYGIDSRIELSKRVISQVMVLNSQKLIRMRPDAKFTQKQVNAMIEHEIGVHMVTTYNSANQALKIFNLGHPVNTRTQEGLAILSEVLSGNITLSRLKKIAFRVIITDMMCSGANFIECFNYLVNDHAVPSNDAYTIVTRIFRGGGFTKDYLYLSGFVEIMRFWKNDNDLSPLLVGKTSIEFYDTIEEMIGREMIEKPRFITKNFLKTNQKPIGNLYSYIISGLK